MRTPGPRVVFPGQTWEIAGALYVVMSVDDETEQADCQRVSDKKRVAWSVSDLRARGKLITGKRR